MRCAIFVLGFLSALALNPVQAGANPEDFSTTTDTVGERYNGWETPVNQFVAPAGTQVQLNDVRPNALALSPDRRLLVTSGLTAELLVLSPATGKILRRVPLPPDQRTVVAQTVSPLVLNAKTKDKLSFTGLVFSPDGRRLYLSNVNGDIKVFGIGRDHTVRPLCAFPLPPADKPGRQNDIPTGLAVSRDGKRLYVALNVSNRIA